MADSSSIGYIIYARKSTDSEDRQIRSIGDQVKILTELAKERGYKIVDIREESKTAKEPGREVFNGILSDIRKGIAQGIIVWNPDRLSRNPIDSGAIIYAFDQKELKEVVTPSQVFVNTPTDKFMLNLLCLQAKLENDNRAVNVIRGLHSKSESGVFPGLAPTGYLNNKYAEKGNRNIYKDNERFELVKRMFDMVLSQKYTPMQVLRIARKEWKLHTKTGKLISKSTWYKMLTSSFYYGEYEYPLGSGKWHKGTHEPMITEEQFDMIQAILGRQGKPRPKSHVFAFTGLMRCGECGARITCEEKIKRQQNGNIHRYIYYHCTKRINPDCTQGCLEEKKLSKQILETLEGIEILEEFHEWALGWLKKENEKESKDRTVILNTQQKAYKACLAKLDELIDMRTSREISPEDFARKKIELEKEKKQLEQQHTNIGERADKWLADADEMLNFAETAAIKFNKGELEDKRYILTRLGSNLILKDRKLDVNLDETLLPLQQAAKEVKKIHERLEPKKSSINKEELFALYSQSPVVLGC